MTHDYPPTATVICGNALEALPLMKANSVHIIVVSPPYYDKRVYSVPPTEWPPVMYSPMPGLEPIVLPGCAPTCKHKWVSEGRMQKPLAHSKKSTLAGGANPHVTVKGKYKGETKPKPLETYVCVKCGGWKGPLGHEPTVELYTAHQIAIYRHARRVLRPDGIFFLNIGDSYSGSGGPGGAFRVKGGDIAGRQYRRGSMGRLRRKNKMGIPWRIAFALQAEGDWILRNDCVWRKTNPLPDNPDDRFASCFEYVFMFTPQEKYYFDNIAVRVPHKRNWGEEGWAKRIAGGASWSPKAEAAADAELADRFVHHGKKTYAQTYDPAGARRKDVWDFATAQTDDTHFAAFPEDLPEICILAGTSAFGVCLTCGAPWERLLHVELNTDTEKFVTKTVAWSPTCGCPLPPHDRLEDCVKPATVLDFFAGTGTTLEVALRLRRSAIGIDLNENYARMMSRNTEHVQYGMFLDLEM